MSRTSTMRERVSVAELRLSKVFDRDCCWFILASSLDVLMTWWLLNHHTGQFFESNPLAGFFLANYGFQGMLGFKIALVAVVVANYTIIIRYKEDVAHRIMNFGTLVVNTVVMYSLALLFLHG